MCVIEVIRLESKMGYFYVFVCVNYLILQESNTKIPLSKTYPLLEQKYVFHTT